MGMDIPSQGHGHPASLAAAARWTQGGPQVMPCPRSRDFDQDQS